MTAPKAPTASQITFTIMFWLYALKKTGFCDYNCSLDSYVDFSQEKAAQEGKLMHLIKTL